MQKPHDRENTDVVDTADVVDDADAISNKAPKFKLGRKHFGFHPSLFFVLFAFVFGVGTTNAVSIAPLVGFGVMLGTTLLVAAIDNAGRDVRVRLADWSGERLLAETRQHHRKCLLFLLHCERGGYDTEGLLVTMLKLTDEHSDDFDRHIAEGNEVETWLPPDVM